MTEPAREEGPGDLIEEYLNRLRAGLRVPPAEAGLILAESEDHLRETTAAGVAVGMSGHEAQKAAISSFGPVELVTRPATAGSPGPSVPST